jgi:hypothetical protein
MKTYLIFPETCGYTHPHTIRARSKFGVVISKTVDLYTNNDVADETLMNGVVEACFTHCKNIKLMEHCLDLSALIGKHDPFSGRLLRLLISSTR